MFGVYPLLHEDPRYNLSGSRYSPEALEQAKKLLRGAVVQVGKHYNGNARVQAEDIGYLDGLEIYEGTLYGTLVTLPSMHPAFHPQYSMHPPNYYRIQLDSTVTIGKSRIGDRRSGGVVREITNVQCWFLKKECECPPAVGPEAVSGSKRGKDRCPVHGPKAEVLTGYRQGSLAGPTSGQEFQAPEMNTATMSDQSKPQPTDFPIIPADSVRDLTSEEKERLKQRAEVIARTETAKILNLLAGEKTFSLTPPLTMTPATQDLDWLALPQLWNSLNVFVNTAVTLPDYANDKASTILLDLITFPGSTLAFDSNPWHDFCENFDFIVPRLHVQNTTRYEVAMALLELMNYALMVSPTNPNDIILTPLPAIHHRLIVSRLVKMDGKCKAHPCYPQEYINKKKAEEGCICIKSPMTWVWTCQEEAERVASIHTSLISDVDAYETTRKMARRHLQVDPHIGTQSIRLESVDGCRVLSTSTLWHLIDVFDPNVRPDRSTCLSYHPYHGFSREPIPLDTLLIDNELFCVVRHDKHKRVNLSGQFVLHRSQQNTLATKHFQGATVYLLDSKAAPLDYGRKGFCFIPSPRRVTVMNGPDVRLAWRGMHDFSLQSAFNLSPQLVQSLAGDGKPLEHVAQLVGMVLCVHGEKLLIKRASFSRSHDSGVWMFVLDVHRAHGDTQKRHIEPGDHLKLQVDVTPDTRINTHNETGQTPVQLISDWTYYHSLERSTTPYHLAVMMGSVEKVVEVYRNIQKQLGALGRDCTIQADLNDCYLRAVLQADREPPYIHVYSQDESGKGCRHLSKIHFFTPELFRDLSPQMKLSFSHFRYIAVDAQMFQEDRDLLRPHQRGEWREW